MRALSKHTLSYYEVPAPNDTARWYSVDNKWGKKVQKGCCSGCSSPGENKKPINVVLTCIDRIEPLSTTEFGALPVGIMSCELAGAIGANNIDRDLLVGTITDAHDQRSTELISFVGREQVIVRAQTASHRICRRCGRLVYNASLGQQYLMSKPVERRRALYTGSSSILLLREDIFARIPKALLRRNPCRRLHVLDLPKDGLPADLCYWPNAKQRAAYLAAGGRIGDSLVVEELRRKETLRRKRQARKS